MASQTVLARVTVDSSGVVTGMDAADRAVATTRTGLINMGGIAQTVTTRMFSLQKAAIALGTAFGIAGVVFALASAIKMLVTDIVSSTEWFAKAKEAVTDWYREIVKGETEAERFARRVKSITEGSGIKTIFDMQATLEELIKKRNDLRTLLNDLEGPGASPAFDPLKGSQKQLQEYLANLGAVVSEDEEQIKRLRFELDRFNAAILQLRSDMGSLLAGESAEAFGPEPGPAAKAGKTPADIMSGQPLGGFILPEEVAAPFSQEDIDRMLAFQAGLGGVRNEMFLLNEQAQIFRTTLDESAAMGEKLQADLLTPWDEFMQSIARGAEMAVVQVDAMNAAMAAMGGVLQKVAAGGRLTFKAFLADMLASLVPVLLALGASLIARGTLTYNPVDIAAGYAAIAGGVAAAIAAGALNRSASGGSSGSRGGGGGGGGGGGRGRGSDQQVTINISGFVGDEATLARYISKITREAGLDGSPA